MVSELIGKYIWLVQSLIAAGGGGLTFKELNVKYSGRFGQSYSRRTFNNHRLAVADLFGSTSNATGARAAISSRTAAMSWTTTKASDGLSTHSRSTICFHWERNVSPAG